MAVLGVLRLSGARPPAAASALVALLASAALLAPIGAELAEVEVPASGDIALDLHVSRSEAGTAPAADGAWPAAGASNPGSSGKVYATNPVRKATPTTTTTTPFPFPYPDMDQAWIACGSPQYIATCGFEELQPICVQSSLGEKTCYRGMCVCVGENGCTEPTCGPAEDGQCPMPCADGQTCLTDPGTGWSCWHPCNTAHEASEYGQDFAPVVEAIRQSGSCDIYNDPQSPLNDMKMDAGLQMWSQKYPYLKYESKSNAGGSSRRRAAPGLDSSKGPEKKQPQQQKQQRQPQQQQQQQQPQKDGSKEAVSATYRWR